MSLTLSLGPAGSRPTQRLTACTAFTDKHTINTLGPVKLD